MIPIPENLMRLQAGAIVHKDELTRFGKDQLMRKGAADCAEFIIRTIINECVRADRNYEECTAIKLDVDVYVLAPEQLHKLLAQAFEKGAEDSMRFYSRNFAGPL